MKKRLEAWGDTKVIAIASCLIFNESGKLLLLRRHSAELGGGLWGFPGGKVEPKETAKAAAHREATEETGLKLAASRSLGSHLVAMPHGTVKLTSFLAEIPTSSNITLNPFEHDEYRWFDVQELLTAPHLLWGIPTILRDFGLLDGFGADPTLADGSTADLVSKA